MDKLHRLIESRRAKIPEIQQRYNESSKEQLLKIIEKKCKTIMIGSISYIEEFFGRELWGYGKTDSERTQEEREVYKLWQDLRTKILNNGNNQIRAIENELKQYDVKWLRYQLEFKASPGQTLERVEKDNGGRKD